MTEIPAACAASLGTVSKKPHNFGFNLFYEHLSETDCYFLISRDLLPKRICIFGRATLACHALRAK